MTSGPLLPSCDAGTENYRGRFANLRVTQFYSFCDVTASAGVKLDPRVADVKAKGEKLFRW